MKIQTSDKKPDDLILINTKKKSKFIVKSNQLNWNYRGGYVIKPKGILKYAKSTEKSIFEILYFRLRAEKFGSV